MKEACAAPFAVPFPRVFELPVTDLARSGPRAPVPQFALELP